MKRIGILLTLCLLRIMPVMAQSIKVAAAANLQTVIKALASDFKQRTGITAEPIIGASGNLTTQIKNGAPFDLFLSADMSFPEDLYKNGFSAKQPIVYAQGSLIICSSQDIGFENWERVLLTERIKKIAIANPAIAPYGKAAEEALKQKGILDNIKSKLVTGESISQVNTYITTGVTDVGFTTQALVAIDPNLYSPIEQGMVLLKHAENNPDAQKFYEYIQSPAAKGIFKEYGYHE
jgi:molybdate transport system substrate-binding protein